jgi:hypothetical protein
MPEQGRRIAMWSGPRNLSTAMMRSFGNRADCVAVLDEPLYAAYLAATGLDHPMRAEILAAQPTDWRDAVDGCLAGPVPPGRVQYQKQMTHHMLPDIPRDWLAGLTNVFLIRDPRRVVASYAARRERATLADLGFHQQAELFDGLAAAGQVPAVVDAEDIRADPAWVLAALCARIGLPFDEAMLRWPPGPRDSDGAWAPHWYGALHASTGFAPPDPPPPQMDAAMEALAEAARPAYGRLRRHRIAATPGAAP